MCFELEIMNGKKSILSCWFLWNRNFQKPLKIFNFVSFQNIRAFICHCSKIPYCWGWVRAAVVANIWNWEGVLHSNFFDWIWKSKDNVSQIIEPTIVKAGYCGEMRNWPVGVLLESKFSLRRHPDCYQCCVYSPNYLKLIMR